MPRYFINLAFRGAPFHGWQSQPDAVSVQSTLEDVLSTVFRTQIKITGAGRTDAGVNAAMMVAHFDLIPPVADFKSALRAIDSLAGPDIAVYSLTQVADDAHARFDATSRTYRYFAVTRKSPFAYPLSWQAPSSLDFDAMNRAAEILLKVDDFTSFSKLHTDVKTNICRVTAARWLPVGPDTYAFEITADRFLRNMVRAIVGTLVDVGRHKISIDGFRHIIDARNRCAAGTSMPPQALFLWNITYPYTF